MSGKGGFKKNPGAAARLLERASVAGGSPRTRLAMLYLEGTGVPKDEARAFELLHSAAAFGDAEGMFRLSLLYKEGKGCEADPEMYRVLVKMAAERGSRDAKDLISRWDERNQRRKAKKY
jgi:TPR repeat protein